MPGYRCTRAGYRPTLLALLTVTLGAASATAEQADPRAYRPDRADEDWSFMKDAPRVDFWDPVKYIPLGEDSFLTVSGEARLRAEGFRTHRSAARPGTVDNYLLQRYLAGVDVRLGGRARVFAEIQSGLIAGRLQSPRPTDRNRLDLHQGFVEWRHRIRREGRLDVKAGRQELAIGSTRLISASPGLNVKRSFDGVGVFYREGAWVAAAAASRLVSLEAGTFDDWSNTGQLFWGGAVSRRLGSSGRDELGAFYLGIDRSLALYAQGVAAERRHTVGVRWTMTAGPATLSYDLVGQWGTFGRDDIRAWAIGADAGYRLAMGGWRPVLSARVNIASGDRDPLNPRLQAFNPLFPGNSYAGAVGLLGPTNITDVTPALSLRPHSAVTIGAEMPIYWRTAITDGIYGTDLRLLARPSAEAGRHVGTNPGVLVVWQITRHVQAQGVVTRFIAGPALAGTFASAGFGFYSTSLLYRF